MKESEHAELTRERDFRTAPCRVFARLALQPLT